MDNPIFAGLLGVTIMLAASWGVAVIAYNSYKRDRWLDVVTAVLFFAVLVAGATLAHPLLGVLVFATAGGTITYKYNKDDVK